MTMLGGYLRAYKKTTKFMLHWSIKKLLCKQESNQTISGNGALEKIVHL